MAYRSLVNGMPGGSVDLQVRWYAEEDPEHVRRLIRGERLYRDENAAGKEVCWELVEVFAVEPFVPTESGEAVAGFIASVDELRELA